MSDQDASMPDVAEESTVRFAAAAANPLDNPLPGPANEIQRHLIQLLPSVLKEVLKDQLADFLQQSLATIETKVQESMSPILTGFKAEVNRLDKTADRMDTGRISAPKRSLDSIMPKIAIKLQGKDFDKIQGMTKKQILRSLHGLPYPACRTIQVARLRAGQRDLVLETDSWSAHQELSKPSIIADMTQKLDLDNLGSTMKHEVFWVVLTEWSFEQGYLDKCQSHIEEWKEDTGLKIRKVKYENGRLLWGFAEASHAIQACSKPLFFSGDRAIAMAFDIRANPMWCRQCAFPGHTSFDPCCEYHGVKDHPWPCLICGDLKGHSKEWAESHDCPNKSNKAIWVCISCKREGLQDTNHRTDWWKCPSEVAQAHMKACRLLLNALPSWAVHVKFPTIQQMKESIEKNVSYKTANGANTQGTNTASQGNGGNGAAVDAGSTVPRIVNRQTMTKKQQADAAAAETGNPGSSSSNTLEGGSAETAIPVSSQGTMQQPGTNLSQLNGFAASFSPAAHSSGDLVQANMSRYFPSMSNTNATFPSEGASSGSIFQTPQRPSSIAPASQTYTPIGSFVHRDVSPRKKTKVGEDNSETRIPGLHHTGSFGVDDDYSSPDYGRRRVPGSTSPTKMAPVRSTQTTEPVRPIGLPKPSTMRPIGSGSQRLEDAVSTQRGRSDAAATVGLGPIGSSVRQASFAPVHEDNSDMMSEASADMDLGDGSSSEDGSDEDDAGSGNKDSAEVHDSAEVDDSVLGDEEDEDEDMDSDTDTVKGGNDSDDEDAAVSGDMGKGKAKA